MRTFLPAMWPAFFIRIRPASRKAKPACMNITSTAVTTTQMVDAATRRSCLDTSFHLLELRAGSVVNHVLDRRRPGEPVAGLVAAACGVVDRGDDVLHDRVGDDEHEQRLRQKARLEHASPVLVRHAALAAVADRLDHGHADVAGCLLDGVDDRLDALSDHHCFDLVHAQAASSSASASTGTVSIVCRMRPAIRYGSPSELGRRSSRYPR